jgi:hypothetical protein
MADNKIYLAIGEETARGTAESSTVGFVPLISPSIPKSEFDDKPRGELRRGLPVGFVWGEQDGEVLLHPDEAVRGVLRAVFERFAEMGSARQVWLWLRAQQLAFPLQSTARRAIRWVTPTYPAVHQVLTSPVYAGAYVYGRTRHERYVDDQGHVRKRVRRLPPPEWAVLLREHHTGCIDWETYEANQQRLASNTRPRPHDPGGAVREGAALLQGLATCGRCGRRLGVFYSGRHSFAWLSLFGRQHRQRQRRTLSADRWPANRSRRGHRVPRGPHPRRDRGIPAGRRTARGGP